MMDLKTSSSQEIAKYFSREVNNLFFKPDGITKEQKGTRQMKELDICWNTLIIQAIMRYTGAVKRQSSRCSFPPARNKYGSSARTIAGNGKMKMISCGA